MNEPRFRVGDFVEYVVDIFHETYVVVRVLIGDEGEDHGYRIQKMYPLSFDYITLSERCIKGKGSTQ